MASCDLRCLVFRFDVRLFGTGMALSNPTFQLQSLIPVSLMLARQDASLARSRSFQRVAERESIRF